MFLSRLLLLGIRGCGILSLLGFLGLAASGIYLYRDQKKIYRLLVFRAQHWYSIEAGPVLVDRSGKRPVAWMEITLTGSKSTVILRPKDQLYRQYVARTTDAAIELPEGCVEAVCLYGRHVIAFRSSKGEIMPLWGKAEFEKEITPPDPKVVSFLRRRFFLIRVMVVGLVPTAFFGLVWIFNRIL